MTSPPPDIFLVIATFLAERTKESKCIVCASHFPSLAKTPVLIPPLGANQLTALERWFDNTVIAVYTLIIVPNQLAALERWSDNTVKAVYTLIIVPNQLAALERWSDNTVKAAYTLNSTKPTGCIREVV